MILAVLQARVSSTRLPGKVLKPLLGQPMILRQVERVRRAAIVDRLVIATSTDASDDPLEALCRENGLDCFRGSLADVLDRFYQAARPYKPDHVVRLTGDCPLADPAVIDDVIRYHLAGGYDYTSNCAEPTYPDGLDAEILTFPCLERVWREAARPSEREHVTLFINSHPGLFRRGTLKNDTDLSHLRWTVDEAADFELVTRIYEALYPADPGFDMRAILRLLAGRPGLASLNSDFERNEGLKKSLAADKT